MDEKTVETVASQLSKLGLTDEIFAAAEIAADLAERTALNATLDDLIGSVDVPPDPATFNPAWDR